MKLHIATAQREQIADWCRAGYPLETCGLLLGESTADGTRVRRVSQARNLEAARAGDRYLLDPRDFAAADQSARDAGLSVVGVWHAHPDHPAEPSLTDLERAWPDWSYLIASVTGRDVVALRSWRLSGEHFVEEELSP